MRSQPTLDPRAGMRRLRDVRTGPSRLATYTPLSADEHRALYASAPPRAVPMRYAAWIGWASSVILLATLIRQAYTQWKSHEVGGVSRWLFVGQVTASVGFTIYSLLLRNWVFASSNIAILMTAIAGEVIYLRNKRARPPGERR